MKQYHDLMQNILDNGDVINTERTGVGTIATFGEQIKFDLRKGFPAVTTKKLAWKAVVSELIWFLRGSDNLYDLRAILHGEDNRFNDEKKTIWDGNYYNQAIGLGYTSGYMGNIYGVQWRDFGRCVVGIEREDSKVSHYDEYKVKGIDQLKLIIQEALCNPQSRRLLVSAWNPKDVWENQNETDFCGSNYIASDIATLPPCHVMYQVNIVGDYVDLQWYQRSVDVFLGLAFNIASYALLLHMIAKVLGKTPRLLVGTFGNTHIYQNHIEQVKEQLSRECFELPDLEMNPHLKTLKDFENATVTDFLLKGYKSHESIKAPMAV